MPLQQGYIQFTCIDIPEVGSISLAVAIQVHKYFYFWYIEHIFNLGYLHFVNYYLDFLNCGIATFTMYNICEYLEDTYFGVSSME